MKHRKTQVCFRSFSSNLMTVWRYCPPEGRSRKHRAESPRTCSPENLLPLKEPFQAADMVLGLQKVQGPNLLNVLSADQVSDVHLRSARLPEDLWHIIMKISAGTIAQTSYAMPRWRLSQPVQPSPRKNFPVEKICLLMSHLFQPAQGATSKICRAKVIIPPQTHRLPFRWERSARKPAILAIMQTSFAQTSTASTRTLRRQHARNAEKLRSVLLGTPRRASRELRVCTNAQQQVHSLPFRIYRSQGHKIDPQPDDLQIQIQFRSPLKVQE